MAIEDDDPSNITGSDPAGTSPKPAEGVTPIVTPTEPKVLEEGVQQVRHSDFKRIKEESRARGRREALDELDITARAAGFTSHEDALRALAELKKSPPAQPAAATPRPKEPPTMPNPKTPAPAAKPNDEAALRKEAMRAQDDKLKMRKQWRVEERRRRDLQAALDAKDAEMGLREELYRAGVKDVDYTLRLLTRQLEGKTQEEIAKFDRNAFYTTLRTDKPYLFGETVAPANTGTDASAKTPGTPGAPPPTPAPGSVTATEADKTKFDARTAKPEEVQARLRSLGLNPHL